MSKSVSSPTYFEVTDGSSPKNQVNLRSYLTLGEKWELDAGIYHVSRLEYCENPSYTRGDLRIGYNPNDRFSFSLGIQNLQDSRHPEEGPDYIGFGSEVERNVYFNLSWRP